MDTVYDKSYIEHDQINSDSAKTPQFSTNSNEFDVSLSQCKNDFLCLNDKSQEMFLRKLVNTDVAVFQDHNSIIDGLFDKYCLGLGSEEKKMLAESLVQSRTRNSDHKEAPVINVAKRNVVHHTKVPKKVAKNANVAKKKIKPVSGKSTLSKIVKWGVLIVAVTSLVVAGVKHYKTAILGSYDRELVNKADSGWYLGKATRLVRDWFGCNAVEEKAYSEAAKVVGEQFCSPKGNHWSSPMTFETDQFCAAIPKVKSKDSFYGIVARVNRLANGKYYAKTMKKIVEKILSDHEKIAGSEVAKKLGEFGKASEEGIYSLLGLEHPVSTWEKVLGISTRVIGAIETLVAIFKH